MDFDFLFYFIQNYFSSIGQTWNEYGLFGRTLLGKTSHWHRLGVGRRERNPRNAQNKREINSFLYRKKKSPPMTSKINFHVWQWSFLFRSFFLLLLLFNCYFFRPNNNIKTKTKSRDWRYNLWVNLLFGWLVHINNSTSLARDTQNWKWLERMG